MLFLSRIYIHPGYRNRLCYHKLMNSYLDESITPTDYSEKYIKQRNKDMDFAEEKGYTHDKYEEWGKNFSEKEKEFDQEYSDVLYFEGIKEIPRYEKAVEKYDISGLKLIEDVYNLIDIPSMEFRPKDDPGFNPKLEYSEERLYEIIKQAYELLERHKSRWEIDCEDPHTKNPDKNDENNHEEKPSSK